jgi:hypothetical protein
MSLTTSEAYLFTFAGKPPLRSTGFWSLTMYNSDGFLVQNPLDIYSVSDRTNITYPNGIPVYGIGGGPEDQPFQIIVQSAAVSPPANWTQK